MIAHIAAGTSTIRVGSGGIMLPNHAPLVIAEQFGTLAELHPGRIDLGLGRAPGTDRLTIAALRRDDSSADTFPQDVVELQRWLEEPREGQLVVATPGAGTKVPLWILGSSLYGAQLAALLGLPYAFASHFAPDALLPALEVYRERFEPSAQLDEPHVMVAANVIAAETDEEARRLFTSVQQSFTNIHRNRRGKLPPPIDDIDAYWLPEEKLRASAMLARSYVGAPETVRAGLEAFVAETAADEVIVASAIWEHQARLRSYEFWPRFNEPGSLREPGSRVPVVLKPRPVGSRSLRWRRAAGVELTDKQLPPSRAASYSSAASDLASDSSFVRSTTGGFAPTALRLMYTMYLPTAKWMPVSKAPVASKAAVPIPLSGLGVPPGSPCLRLRVAS